MPPRRRRRACGGSGGPTGARIEIPPFGGMLMTMAETSARDADADHRFAASRITGFITDVMAAVGLPPGDAAKVAELMTEADLTGADAHGIFRLPQYVRRIRAGGFNTRPHITVEKTAAATALVDGDNGMGHLV